MDMKGFIELHGKNKEAKSVALDIAFAIEALRYTHPRAGVNELVVALSFVVDSVFTEESERKALIGLLSASHAENTKTCNELGY